jgi:hypothetical protein
MNNNNGKKYVLKPLQRFIPLEQAAKMEGVTTRAIYRRVQAGRIPAVNIEGMIAVSAPKTNPRRPQLEDFRQYRGKEKSLLETARLLRIPAKTISNWHKSGKIPARRAGKYVMLPLDYLKLAEALYKYVRTIRGSTQGIDIFSVV